MVDSAFVFEHPRQLGCSQTVTGVTVMTRTQAQVGPGGARRVPRGPRKGPIKEVVRERAVKAKVDAVCF
jgi:hypothetical protein